MSYPYIEYEGKKLYQVGCRNCGHGNNWRIYSDGEDSVAKCGDCGYVVEIKNRSFDNLPLVNKPDRSEK